MQKTLDDSTLPPSDVETCILPTQQMMERWRTKMALLTECDYNDGELGLCITQAFLNAERLDEEIQTCVNHFANRFTDHDFTIVHGAMVELMEGMRILFNKLPLRTPNGQFPFVFHDWLEDDMVVARLPY